MTTLAATRNATIGDAVDRMEKLAQCACRLAVTKARRAKRLTDIESEFRERLEADETECRQLRTWLAEFCRANAHLFVRPRKIQTPFGEFGLQRVSDLKIDDEEALLQTLLDHDYDDCLKIARSVVKDAVRARLEAGERLPGATVRVEENDPVVKVKPALLKAAVETA